MYDSMDYLITGCGHGHLQNIFSHDKMLQFVEVRSIVRTMARISSRDDSNRAAKTNHHAELREQDILPTAVFNQNSRGEAGLAETTTTD